MLVELISNFDCVGAMLKISGKFLGVILLCPKRDDVESKLIVFSFYIEKVKTICYIRPPPLWGACVDL